MGSAFRMAAAALAVSASLAANAIAAEWTVVNITPEGLGRALAINASGTVVGCRMVDGSRSVAWVYANGARAELPAPAGANSCAFAINDNGTIAGTIDNEITTWQDGTAHGLGLEGEVAGIGESGAVVGSANGRAIMVSNGIVTDLGPGRAFAINRRNQVAIIAQGKLFMYENGTLHDLGATVTNAWGLNDRAEIVGMTSFGHGPEAFMFDATVHQIPGSSVEGGAVAINNVGAVLVSGEGTYGALVEAGQQVTLGAIAATSGGQWGHMEGKAVNDRGWIVGQESSGQVRAFLMMPKEASTSPPALNTNPAARPSARTRPLVEARTP